jgi:predicted ABC-type ATPase
MEKILFIIAGCNGAGKTTAAYNIMPHVLNVAQFVNADEIARGLSPFNPESVAIEAGRIMLNRIDELLEQNKSLTIETTLATRSYARLIQKAHQKGYNVILLYFWLNSPELAIERVATRVRNGGHNIPADIIRRRYNKSICNLFRIFLPICDVWNIYDNSDNPRKAIASGVGKDILKITDIDIFNQLKNYAR